MPLRPSILVVEDDQLVAETIVSLLTRDYNVVQVASVAAALASLGRRCFDFVLLDCLLPDGSAETVLAAIDDAGIAVVLTSGDLREADRAAHDRVFLAKPFAQKALLAALDSVRR